MLTLKWIQENGGINFIEQRNKEKSDIIYAEIDRNPLFLGIVNKNDRSIMNATFTLKDDSLKEKFDTMCYEAGIIGINGHRSVGGYRASMYNALEIESVKILVEIMQMLEKKS